ncbi:hypothetical protein ABES02_08540 [Neobacillus pocheonensis]|uniref:hypothetical protein n=1 Tax=Neobacillus pocheonensis TaxID=363869 RepID=UPI003D28295C
MKTVSVSELTFKNHLSMVEQIALKDLLLKWVGGIDEFLRLEYTESVFAKLEATQATALPINEDELFRYVTITEDNQIVIGVLDSNQELEHRIISLDEVLRGKHF